MNTQWVTLTNDSNKEDSHSYQCAKLHARSNVFSRCSILPDMSASLTSQGKRKKPIKVAGHVIKLCRSAQVTRAADCLKHCLPFETTGRICLAVSCWMVACVCLWKTSMASHLQGSSTTSALASSPGESRFHISVAAYVQQKKKKYRKNHPHCSF